LNRVCSIFSQLLQFFPRLEFEQAVRKPEPNDMLAVHLLGPIIAMLLSVGKPVRCARFAAAAGLKAN